MKDMSEVRDIYVDFLERLRTIRNRGSVATSTFRQIREEIDKLGARAREIVVALEAAGLSNDPEIRAARDEINHTVDECVREAQQMVLTRNLQ